MIVVGVIAGRLGNELFCITGSKYYADKHNAEYYVRPLYEDKGTADYIDKIKGTFFNEYNFIDQDSDIYEGMDISADELSVKYTPIESNSDKLAIIGYRQSPKYWENDREYALNLWRPSKDRVKKVKDLYKDVDFSDAYSLHLRLLDDIDSNIDEIESHIGILSIDYYYNCLKMIPEDAKVIITSNKIEEAKKYFVGDRFIFADKKNENSIECIANDLCISTLCGKGNIIGNSTFAWWGAYLNENKDIKVFYPSQFFRFTEEMDIIPDDDRWIPVERIWAKARPFKLNVICNDCVGGELYRNYGQRYNNPFIWTILPFKDFKTLYEKYDEINFNDYEYQETPNYYFRWYMSSIRIDNKLSVYYPHHMKIEKSKKLEKVVNQANQTGYSYYKMDEYLKERYAERIVRMKESDPVFIFSQENRNSDEEIRSLLETKSRHKLIFITSNDIYLSYACERIRILVKPQNEISQVLQARWIRDNFDSFLKN